MISPEARTPLSALQLASCTRHMDPHLESSLLCRPLRIDNFAWASYSWHPMWALAVRDAHFAHTDIIPYEWLYTIGLRTVRVLTGPSPRVLPLPTALLVLPIFVAALGYGRLGT